MEDIKREGFNPYFIGLPILIPPRSILPMLPSMFQSLFYWITYSYAYLFEYYYYMKMLFQSLFYWITYSYRPLPTGITGNGMLVSILILLDYLFLYEHEAEQAAKIFEQVSILILLDYLFLWSLELLFKWTNEIVSILILLDYLFLWADFIHKA